MPHIHNLNRPRVRSVVRNATRMLGGRRRPPNALVLACRALEKVFKIDRHLLPYAQEQAQLERDRVHHAEIDAVLEHVYGPDFQ